MDLSYWRKQTASKPLFADIEWSKPEQRAHAGRLGIVGGSKLGFAGVAESYSVALEAGVGEVRVLLPNALKKTIPTAITDTVFAATTPSGSLARDALSELRALGEWATGVLLVGDAGRNSETAITYEEFVANYSGQLTLTRDAVDLLKNSPRLIVERPDTLIVASFAQTQKLFSGVYYPKILTFSMQLMQLVEALHKFTITYPCTVVTLHRDTLIIASGGQVITQDFTEPMRIWRGETATRMASYWLWNPAEPLGACAAAAAAP
jgi:ADP-dependent NAD(P)H-hydrate dehydratase / NAD(P)H-hydrate epimerase